MKKFNMDDKIFLFTFIIMILAGLFLLILAMFKYCEGDMLQGVVLNILGVILISAGAYMMYCEIKEEN